MNANFSWVMITATVIMISTLSGKSMQVTTRVIDDSCLVSKSLKPDEVLLEYFLTDTIATLNAYTREAVCCATVSLNSLFWGCLRSFRENIKSAEPAGFTVCGTILYNFLVKPVTEFMSGNRRLIIIPGERLAGLPFEAIVTGESLFPNQHYDANHYLVMDYEIVYRQDREHKRDTFPIDSDLPDGAEFPFYFMGVSPDDSRRGVYPALPGARSEVAEICRLFHERGMNAEMICGGPPEIARFMQLAHQGRIVHLAGHYRAAQPDCSGGGFVFAGSGNGKELPVQDEMLTMEEIESMHITPELLVLNACATGKDGNIQAATNILATLWNIPDILARDFMLDFYKYCLAGKSYSEALREVKLQWISCRATSLPVVWAPYVLTEK